MAVVSLKALDGILAPEAMTLAEQVLTLQQDLDAALQLRSELDEQIQKLTSDIDALKRKYDALLDPPARRSRAKPLPVPKVKPRSPRNFREETVAKQRAAILGLLPKWKGWLTTSDIQRRIKSTDFYLTREALSRLHTEGAVEHVQHSKGQRTFDEWGVRK